MILVTGGAGFIGSALIYELNQRGYQDIFIVDRLQESEKWQNLVGLKYREYFLADDFFHVGFIDEMFENLEAIFHLGACSSTTEKNMDFLYSNNVDFSKNLFLLAADHDIPIIYASSAATYGSGEQGYSDSHQTIESLRPLNRYGLSKHLVDRWVLSNDHRPSRWYGLKFFNVFGPGEFHKDDMRSLVHKAYGQIKERGRVELFMSHKEGIGDGQQARDFIYVKDCARAMVEILKNEEMESGIYNMGTGVARTFKDLVSATFKAMGQSENIDFIPMPENIRHQYQYYTCAHMEKFHQAMGGQFQFSELEKAVEDYIVNYLAKGKQTIC